MTYQPLDEFCVDVIVPARNAGGTIRTTLNSLVAQTHPCWQATVIDDGSTDDTAEIAAGFAAHDSRFRVLSGPHQGVGAARNRGLAAASAPWILFLDSDDTIAPRMLEKMIAGLRADPAADAIHCGWKCVDPEGNPIDSRRCELLAADLFPLLANTCAFAIHACVIRRSQLEKAGGFDETLRTSEDFDLWQRVARIGTRFTAIPDLLSVYVLRPDASWFDSGSFLDGVLRVVRRGHAADPRLAPSLVTVHRDGAPADRLTPVEVRMTTWAAAMAIARGEDPGPLLKRINLPPRASVDPEQIGNTLFQAIPLTLCQPPSSWPSLISTLKSEIDNFLQSCGQLWEIPALRERALRAFEARIVAVIVAANPASSTPVLLGKTAVLCIDVESPISDFRAPDVVRVACMVRAGEHTLGLLMLPMVDGELLSPVIADAIAGRFAWQLLEIFFARQNINAQLSLTRNEQGWQVSRSSIVLGEFGEGPSLNLHDRVGWTIFLQELFNLPQHGAADFYGSEVLDPSLPPRSSCDENIFELTEPIQSILDTTQATITVRGTIGGAPVAVAQVPTKEGVASEADIRLALLANARMELVRTAVREALLGIPLDDPRGLHQRLRDRAAERSVSYIESLVGAEQGSVIVLGAPRASRTGQLDRRLTLPAIKADLLLQTASDGQPVLRLGEGAVRRVLFLPELPATRQEPTEADLVPSEDCDASGRQGRQFFESLFASSADPWHYSSPYEQKKYQQTLSLIPQAKRVHALEVGCAQGHFTAQLLPLVRSLVASDISELALRRTAERCGPSTKLSFQQMDLTRDSIRGTYDLIVCSEMLYYVGGLEALTAATQKLADALKPGGCLITAHASMASEEPDATGFDWGTTFGSRTIGETLAAIPELIFDKEICTPLYRIQRFRRRGLLDRLLGSKKTSESKKTVEFAEHAMPEPDVAAQIVWAGRPAAKLPFPGPTNRLPILTYHSVAESGPATLARWRVTPKMFAEQMQYLHQTGFATTTLAAWRAARKEGKPLSGRRVLITFDDAYTDFEEFALPILQANGFSATMFVPSDRVGGRATWDSPDGEQLKLMDWNALRRLRDAGITIGAHSRTHPRLTELSMEDLVDELAGARLAIRRELQIEVDAIAYPFGAYDEIVARTAAACGYVHGLTTVDRPSALNEDGLTLSRIDAAGHETLEQFIATLS